jgi:hypothetical protein
MTVDWGRVGYAVLLCVGPPALYALIRIAAIASSVAIEEVEQWAKRRRRKP